MNEKDNISLRVTEMAFTIVKEYEEEQFNTYTGLPETLYQRLHETISHIKVNSKLHLLTFQNEKLLSHNHKWWILQDQYNIILRIICNVL